MKKLIGLIGILTIVASFVATDAQALTARSRSIGVGYSQATFIIDTADPDSAVKKAVLFYGTSLVNMIRKDSLTSSITDPDSIAKAVGTFEEGVTYYWYFQIIDSTTTIYSPFDYATAPNTFTTTNLEQNVSVIYTGYSTVGIMIDSAGLGIGVGIDSVRLDLDKADGTTYNSSITTVTFPQDTFAITGLDENVLYWARVIAFLTDSSAADTLTAFSFTTTDLSSSILSARPSVDSLIIIIDSVGICPDSIIVQWGAGLIGIATNADTTTSANCPDTVIFTGIIEGSTISYRVISFLPDSSAIDTGTVQTYSRPSNVFISAPMLRWPANSDRWQWEFDGAGSYSTSPIPIESQFIRIHLAIDGEDDVSTGDSLKVFVYSWEMGDSTIIDTLVAPDPDTVTITPLILRMWPSDYSDTSLVLYPPFDWGTHYSVSAVMTDTTIYEDSTIGIRTVHMIIEEMKPIVIID